MMTDFYDRLAPYYHLIFADWDGSIARQGGQLAGVIRERWGTGVRSILDVSCGIGTQALGLAGQGFSVTASDLSPAAVARAKVEATNRGLEVDFSVGDMRAAFDHHRRQFDVVISCDNSITHLLTDADLLSALIQMHDCTRPGGGCLVTVRDYDREERGTGLVKPYGLREDDGRRYILFQVWDFQGDVYDLSMFIVVDDWQSERLATHVMRTKYYAVGTDRLLSLMWRAGFDSTKRLDGCFYQPVLVGTRVE
jgi:SAM-dependent methyltransferase